MNWVGRRVVVTGAGGFIGSHLCERLLALGAEVRAVVHGDTRSGAKHIAHLIAERTENLSVFGGDVRDAAFIRSPILEADTVFHLAAVTSVAYSYEHPEETVETNTMGTLNVCAAAREDGVRRLVHTSTAGAYGNAQNDAPITEEHPVMGCNPYTAGKLGGDYVAQTYHLSYDLPVTILRLFNTYGPRMGRYLIMPNVIEQLLRGPELELGDLSPTRCFTYVDDIVDAYLLMADADNVLGEVVHFGSPDDIRMSDLVARIAKLMDRSHRVVRDPARLRPAKSEIHVVRVDIGKAERLLDWRPQVRLDEGLKRTIDWITNTGYPEEA